jgi:hypothetical protein
MDLPSNVRHLTRGCWGLMQVAKLTVTPSGDHILILCKLLTFTLSFDTVVPPSDVALLIYLV